MTKADGFRTTGRAPGVGRATVRGARRVVGAAADGGNAGLLVLAVALLGRLGNKACRCGSTYFISSKG